MLSSTENNPPNLWDKFPAARCLVVEQLTSTITVTVVVY